jgi:hypothetical protein
MNKNVLIKELGYIQDIKIHEWTAKTLQNAPDYFFTASASSTGKYHPPCTLGEGGLIVHVQRAVFFANRLCSGQGVVGRNRDIVLSATILHDIAKTGQGSGAYSDYVNHPINAIKYLYGVIVDGTTLKTTNAGLDLGSIVEIYDCIRFHMTLWSPENIKKPIEHYTQLELIVGTADYLAATKEVITPEDGKRTESGK